MSKSKKSARNGAQNKGSAQNCENNMSYASDKKTDNASDCHGDNAQNKNESNCQ